MADAASEALSTPPGYSVGAVRLRGVVAALPQRRLENDAFVETLGATGVAEVTKMIGVQARYWVEGDQTASDLCHAAAARLIAALDWDPASIDAVIFVSQTFDQPLPATACVLHGRLGLSPHCQAFDVGLGCSGYVYGLWLASSLISTGCRRILLLCGDTISRVVDLADRATALLFGDAGSASALERDPEAPAAAFVLGTDGGGASNLMISGGGFRKPAADPRRPAGLAQDRLFMDGGDVFSFTLKAVPKLVQDALRQAGRTADEIDSFVLHQANAFMLRHLAKKIGAPDRTPINIDRYGNTSSASIPLLLATDLADRLTSDGARLMLVGFGVGYSWGAAVLDVAPLACAETVSL